MRNRIIISLLCVLLICCTAAYSFATSGIVNSDDLRLRSANSTDSGILTLLSVNEKVEIITKTDDGWYKIKYKDYEGYVKQEYITVTESEAVVNTETNVSEESKTTVEENNSQVTTSNETVNTDSQTTKTISKGEVIYGTPLINSNTLVVVDEDKQVVVETEMNGWSYISGNEIEGWVRTETLNGETTQKVVGYINASGVNFRTKASTDGDVISELTLNKEVQVLEKTNGWTKIKVNNEVGYVLSKYVSDSKVTTTTRSSGYRTKSVTTSTNAGANEASNANATSIVEYAKQYLGYKYVYGGSTPSGFDCSGFTQYVFAHFGYSLSRTASSQASNGVAIGKSNLQAGDLLCFSGSNGSTSVSHVGIYIGSGKFIHAANSRKGVIISNVDGDGFYFVCARRIK